MCRSIELRKGPAKRLPPPPGERGAVLLLVLLVLVLISTLVLSWAQEWRTELRLAANFQEAHQCRRLAEAGIYYALGKMITSKSVEMSPAASWVDLPSDPSELWRGDQSTHLLELPAGRVEVRVADEAGKINLNRAPDIILMRLFTVLGFSEPQVLTMVDSIQDWRSRDDQLRPHGAKNDYYLSLDPPYVCKNGFFETVEELAWVRGFESPQLIPQLGKWLSVEGTGQAVNINTAPLEVLEALGFPPEVANTVVTTRQTAPFRNIAEIAQMATDPILMQFQQFTFQSSPFFTVISKGMIDKNRGYHTIKALVKLDLGQSNPWEIVSWVDDFPG
jgi:general secretion pathway protein K